MNEETTDLCLEFTKCLGTMSYSRAGCDYEIAGCDYELPSKQRAEERRQEEEALARAREIWAANPDKHADLRAAFDAANPIASMREIENPA